MNVSNSNADTDNDRTSPTDLDRGSLKQVLLRTKDEIDRDRVSLAAGGVTFFIVLSIFPALSAFISLYGLYADPTTVTDQLQRLAGYVPEAVVALLTQQLTRLTETATGTLGLTFFVSLMVALWGASKGVKALFEAMNIAYNEREDRGFVALSTIALLFTLGGAILGAILLNATVVLPAILRILQLGAVTEAFGWIAIPVTIVAFGLVSILALYRFGPSRDAAKWRWIIPGALFAVLAWLALSSGFAFYLANFADYGATYGSLGAVVGLMVWIYLSTFVLILGAELNAEMEREVVCDTTTGQPETMGSRGAVVADTKA